MLFTRWLARFALGAFAALACTDVRDVADGSSDARVNDAPGDALVDAGAPMGPRGLYVPTFAVPIASDTTLQQVLDLPYVDGLFVIRYWSQIEKVQGQYDFESTIGADVRAAAAKGKLATLAIGAGINSPSYVCKPTADGGAGAQCISLVVHFAQGNQQCLAETLPLPWDPVLQQSFAAMVTALGAYIRNDAQLAATIVDVKITGFNDHDAETILPASDGGVTACDAGNACNAGVCNASDSNAVLANAGYGDDASVAAFSAFAATFRAAFPNLPIGSQVTKVMPPPGSQTLPVMMVQALVSDPTLRPLTVQDNGLTAVSGIDPGTALAWEAGVPIGYQMLASVDGNAACLMGRRAAPDGGDLPCTEDVLRMAIDNGLNAGARWLEIYKQDAVGFPDASTYAHARLMGP